MTKERITELISVYRDGLLDDTIPFWLKHGIDPEYGGVMTSLNRDGSLVDTDKSVWVQGRFGWTLANLYNTVEKRPEWLDASRSCIDFMIRHCFDDDGSGFFDAPSGSAYSDPVARDSLVSFNGGAANIRSTAATWNTTGSWTIEAKLKVTADGELHQAR